MHLVRTHLGADDTAYRCVYQQEDEEGIIGVKLAKARPRTAAWFGFAPLGRPGMKRAAVLIRLTGRPPSPSDRANRQHARSLYHSHSITFARHQSCMSQGIPQCAPRAGVYLVKKTAQDLMAVAGKALKANITALGPRVLPLSEQLRFAANMVARRCLGMKVAPYVPDFSCALLCTCAQIEMTMA